MDAEYLKDKNGKFINDPKTGKPYVVPVGYSPYDTINKVQDSEIIAKELFDYATNRPNDLQRSFNGISHGGFVPAFTPIASFDVGVACASITSTATVCKIGGGLVNLKNRISNPKVNIDGDFFNNPKNPPNINKGYDWAQQKSFDRLLDKFKKDPSGRFQEINRQFRNSELWIAQKGLEAISGAAGNISPTEHMDDASWSNFWDGIKKWFKDLPLTIGLPDDASESEGDRKRANDKYNDSKNWQPPRDPLVLDLNGGGIKTVGIGNKPILFDHNGDGIKTATGWVDGAEGLLALDLNGNGVIDSGQELFGDNTLLADGRLATNGFEALAQHDSNGDGKIDRNDAIFAKLRIWKDANQDGISQANELTSLAQEGIASINLQATQTHVDLGNGNTKVWTGSFTRTNGSTGETGAAELAGSLNLASNPFYSAFTDNPELTETARSLPQIAGSGLVRDLRAAMSLNTPEAQALVQRVQALAQATTREKQLALIDDVITAWAQTSGKMPSNPLERTVGEFTVRILPAGLTEASADGLQKATAEGAMLLRRLAVLEAFMGASFFNLPESFPANTTARTITTQDANGNTITQKVITRNLSAQQVALLNESWDLLVSDVYRSAAMQTRLQPYLNQLELTINKNGNIVLDASKLLAQLEAVKATDEAKALMDLADLNLLGLQSSAELQIQLATALEQWKAGLAANSPLHAQLEGLNLFSSAKQGSNKRDIWRATDTQRSYSSGDGNDVLFAARTTGSSLNAGNGNDVLDGGDGNDRLHGDNGNDSLMGGVGDDYLYGGDGSDYLLGGEGNDYLYADGEYGGGDGNDTLDGGAGNDVMAGGFGSETYLFGRGDGKDTIVNYQDSWNGRADPTVGKKDVLQFKEGVAASDVIATRNRADLVLQIKGTTDQVTVQNYFENDGFSTRGYALDLIRFADGTSWSLEQVKQMVQQGTEGNDMLYAYSTGSALNGQAGNDSLYGAAGSDTLLGGAGNDYLSGCAGNDTYVFGKNFGQDSISEYDNTAGNLDIARFTEVNANQLWFRRSGDNLEVSVIGTADKVTINNWYSGTAYRVEQFESADGKVLTQAHVDALVAAMAAFAPPAAGQSALPQDYQSALQPVLATSWK